MLLKRRWTEEEDRLLTSTVLDYIKSGKTQLQAFEVVAEKLNRSPDACGFRWNGVLRKKYKNEIAEAYNEKMKTRKAMRRTEVKKPYSNELYNVIDEIKQIIDEKKMLEKEVQLLRKELQEKNRELMELREKYQLFVRVINEARKNVILEGTVFKMSKNGNLERIQKGV